MKRNALPHDDTETDEGRNIRLFAEALVEELKKTPAELRTLLEARLEPTNFVLELPKQNAARIKKAADTTFGAGSVKLKRPEMELRINRQYLKPLQDAFEQIATEEMLPAKAAPAPVPAKPAQEIAPEEAQQLILALCDAGGMTTKALGKHLAKDSDVMMITKPLFKPALQVSVDRFLRAASTPKGARINVTRDRVSFSNAARRALTEACSMLPDELESYQPKQQPFDHLRTLLTTNPGMVAFLEYVSDVSVEPKTTTTSVKVDFDSSGEGDKKDNKLPNMGEIEQTSVTGMLLARHVPQVYQVMFRNIDNAVRAIDIAHDGPQMNRIHTLGLKLDTVRTEIEATLEEIDANCKKSKEFAPPPLVTEWLSQTLKALDPKLVEHELEVRRTRPVNGVV